MPQVIWMKHRTDPNIKPQKVLLEFEQSMKTKGFIRCMAPADSASRSVADIREVVPLEVSAEIVNDPILENPSPDDEILVTDGTEVETAKTVAPAVQPPKNDAPEGFISNTIPPAEVLGAMDFNELRTLAKDNGVRGNQSKDKLIEELVALRKG